MDLYKFINIDENSRVPKYQQIVDSVIENISKGNFNIDEKIPSINRFSEEFYLSRDTVEKAYSILKERNIITSIRGKGFYISRTKLISKVNILFLINKLSNYKLRTYNHFIDAIGANSHTDLHVYHCDETLFLNLIDKNKSAYDYFIIMPHFKTDDLKHVSFTDKALKALEKIPQQKLIILDNIKPEMSGALGEVYQDFENDIYGALNEGLTKIKKYQKIILVYPEKAVHPYPRRILHGFRKFCVEHNLDFEIIDKVYHDMILKKGDLFITIEEADLVNLVKQVREDEYILGSDIGIISYNDTPLKDLLGITVISTDFKVMGETAAQIILNKKKLKLKAPFNLIERDSL
ncbi:GntR family transcriptional regulator [Algibacter luteus]|uniref:Transcriptional regulator, GntR family n=1 Tax=Algibacter luteus TaxID=1178825 RepID=A0A1M6A2L7_9FLAO|nr:GntR family transcriptional regulator [Algibacter luteus]WJJ97776.1 GntR family transcriptional regulator [Algibacter luteus]SHI30710.1 transcriptional regulator, GntR family [Algibacter luteus]